MHAWQGEEPVQGLWRQRYMHTWQAKEHVPGLQGSRIQASKQAIQQGLRHRKDPQKKRVGICWQGIFLLSHRLLCQKHALAQRCARTTTIAKALPAQKPVEPAGPTGGRVRVLLPPLPCSFCLLNLGYRATSLLLMAVAAISLLLMMAVAEVYAVTPPSTPAPSISPRS